jgi:dolichyl-phosphate beta-glucosyltransferase
MVIKSLSGINYKLLENGVNRGKGFSVRRGVLESTGDLVLFSDADISTPIEEFGKLESELKDGYDLAIGSRGLKDSKIEIRQTWVREHMGKIFNFLARLLTFKGIRDSQCGFKCFKKGAAKKLFSEQKIEGFCFDAEIIYLAQKKGYKIKEVPVRWRNSSKSKLHIVSDPLKMFLDLVKIRFLH